METEEAPPHEDADISALLQRAKELFEERNYGESNRAYFGLLERKAELGDIYPVYAAVGENYLWLGKFAEAKKWIGKSLQHAQSPNRIASARARLAAAESLLKNCEGELQHCLAAVRLFDKTQSDYNAEDEYDVYDMLGAVSLMKGEAVTAERYLTQALAIHDAIIKQRGMAQLPMLAHTLCNLGYALVEQGRPDEAIEMLKRALKCHRTRENNFEIYRILGAAYYDKWDFAMSASYFEQAIRHVDERSKAASQYYLLALAYQYLGDHAKALSSLQACLDGKVDLRRGGVSYAVPPAEIYRLIGAEMYVLGRREEGEEWYRRAMEESDHPASRRETMEWMAGSLARCGETERAVELYQRAADLAECEAGKARAYSNIAGVLWNAGKLTRCKDWLEMSVRVHPTKDTKKWLRRVRHHILRRKWFG